MQGSRSRASTPPPRVVREPPGAASSSPNVSQACDTKAVAQRRCTDFCCLLALLGFAACAVQVAIFAVERHDLRKLVRGFDHRGRLCGVGNGTEQQKLLYWCPAGDVLNWASPVCVSLCPEPGSEVLCPGQREVTDEELAQEDGSIVLVRTEKQLLSPQRVLAESQLWMQGYCVPASMKPSAALIEQLQSMLDTSMSGNAAGLFAAGLPQIAMSLAVLVDTPRVICCCIFGAIVLSLLYLLCLHYFAVLFVHFAILGSSIAAAIAGCSLLSLPGASNALGLESVPPAAAEVASSLASALPRVDMTEFPLMNGLHPLLAGSAGAGLLLLALLGVVFLVYSWRSLTVACDCIREACAVIFAMPSLLLLPVFDAALSLTAVLLLATGLPVLLSTAHVESTALLGVTGLFRNFELGFADYGRLATWAFACLWFQEILGTLGHFATAYAVATWYFVPGRNLLLKTRNLPFFPALKGLFFASTCHLGSIARGSFAIALLRFLRWAIFLAEHMLCRKREDHEGSQRRRCSFLSRLCQSLIASLQLWAEFLNEYAYIDIALSSEPYKEAAKRACNLLKSHAAVVALLALISKFLCFAGSVALSVVAGLVTYALAAGHPHLGSLGELSQDLRGSYHRTAVEIKHLEAELQILSPQVVAFMAGVTTLFASRAVLSAVDATARTLLYCLLWDASDGVLDATHVPESFRIFAEAKGLAKPKKLKQIVQ